MESTMSSWWQIGRKKRRKRKKETVERRRYGRMAILIQGIFELTYSLGKDATLAKCKLLRTNIATRMVRHQDWEIWNEESLIV